MILDGRLSETWKAHFQQTENLLAFWVRCLVVLSLTPCKIISHWTETKRCVCKICVAHITSWGKKLHLQDWLEGLTETFRCQVDGENREKAAAAVKKQSELRMAEMRRKSSWSADRSAQKWLTCVERFVWSVFSVLPNNQSFSFPYPCVLVKELWLACGDVSPARVSSLRSSCSCWPRTWFPRRLAISIPAGGRVMEMLVTWGLWLGADVACGTGSHDSELPIVTRNWTAW